MALRHPNRVRSLTLYATGSGEFSDRSVTRGIPLEFVLQLLDLGWDRYREQTVRGSTQFVDPTIDPVERYAASHRGQLGTDVASYLRHVVARQEHETSHLLGSITAPTLVLIGEEDGHQGYLGTHLDSSRFLAKSIPNAKLAVISGGAHAMHVELPAEFNQTLGDFIGAH
jgi:pimeloyl-ACP methyl ester carboxylesterase